MDKQAKIYVAGHRGMVGSALVRRLAAGGYSNVLTRSRAELDLLNQAATLAFLQQEKPDFIFIAAAKVGGIHANNTCGRFHLREPDPGEPDPRRPQAGVQRLCFLGSSCIYPRDCAAADGEEYLLTGPLGADQRALRHRQDRRHQAVRKLQPAVRATVFLGDADQPLRPQRQLRPGQQPCAAGADPQGA
jgi:hypothetical protein